MSRRILKKIFIVFIAILSAGWLLPLSIAYYTLLDWLYYTKFSEDGADFTLNIEFSQGLFNVAAFWLGIVICIWSIIILNKLWYSQKTT